MSGPSGRRCGPGSGSRELSNGFASCEDPAGLQTICDRLQPGTIEVFAQRWLHRIPMPFGSKDRDAGYWQECSMRQAGVSRTVVFDVPRRARSFFEALIADNLDLGRPENVEIIFGRRVRCDTPGTFRTAIDRPVIDPDDKGVVVNISCKHSRAGQYLKEGRAMRIETVINCPPRPGLQRPPAQPGRTAGQGPGGSAILGSWPWPAPLLHPAGRHRHHQQEPARLDDRTARRPLHRRSDDL